MACRDEAAVRHPRFPLLAWCIAAWWVTTVAWGQGTPSGEYGELPIGGSVEGHLAGVLEGEVVVYHTYAISIPPDAGAVTVRVDGFGSDVDLALKLGAPIMDYEDVDHLDIGEDPNPSHTVDAPTPGWLYVDVLNLLTTPARYRLTVTAAGAGATPTTPAHNPLAPRANPLAPAASDPLLGTFEGDGLSMTVEGGAGAYRGELSVSGQSFPFEATGGAGRLEGQFVSGGASFAFDATLAGDTLTVSSGGGTYVTRRLGVAPPAPANPLGSGPAPGEGEVLARGPYGTLTRDAATAFIDALEFSLAEAGYQQAFSPADRALLLQTLAESYASLAPSEQAALAEARTIWSRVQANWATASLAEREEFVVGVFVLAFGEEAVQQALGGGGAAARSGGANASCGTIDDCMSTYAPEAYQDTINTQSCWAAAGCESYDPEFNSFTYDTSYD